MMTLIQFFTPESPPQVSRSLGIGFTYEFVKRSTIPWVESGINFCADFFGASIKLDVLQDKFLKKTLAWSSSFDIICPQAPL